VSFGFKELMLFKKEHMKVIDTLCGRNAELLVIEAGSTNTYTLLKASNKRPTLTHI
jgi:hypothetical protein